MNHEQTLHGLMSPWQLFSQDGITDIPIKSDQNQLVKILHSLSSLWVGLAVEAIVMFYLTWVVVDKISLFTKMVGSILDK